MRFWLLCHLATCAVVGATVAACSTGAPGPGVDVRRAVGHVDALVALGPHPGDSPAAQSAARYIEVQLQEIGVRVERMAVGTVALPAIEVAGVRRREASTRVTTDPDLLVRFGPTNGRAVLVMAHYDTVAGSPGAVDNAAAVAVVIELARALATTPPAIPVMLAFTANEEGGLVGAEALAERHHGEVAVAIALDLIGGSGDLSLNGASALIGRREMAWLADAADRAGVVVRAPLPHRVVSRAWPQAERSDHGPFTRRGTPAFHLYHRGQDGEHIDLAYHSARDVAARVDRRSLDETGRLLRALTEQPPPGHGGDAVWLPVAINVVVPRWIVIALEIALAAVGLAMFTALRGTRETGGLGLIAGIVCFAAAAAVVSLAERYVAGSHPAPWLHAPARALGVEALLFAGVLALLVVVARRISPWVGDLRYLALGIVLPLSLGVGCLVLGAAELAWLWLVPGAAAAVAPRMGRFGLLAVLVGLLPGVLVLDPAILREAAWNGFWPIGIPLAVWIAAFAASPLLVLAWWLRKAAPAGPLASLVMPLAGVGATVAGLVLLANSPAVCTAQQFSQARLACEVASPR